MKSTNGFVDNANLPLEFRNSRVVFLNFGCYKFHLHVKMTARDWHFGFETSRFQNFCQIFEGFGFGFGKFGFGKKVSVSKKFGLGKKSRFRFRKIWFWKKSIGFGFKKIWSRKKVSVSVSENLVSEKKSRFRFRKNLVSEKSLGLGFGKFGLGKEKIQITRTVLVMMSQIWDQSPEMVPYIKSQFCSQVPNFNLVARCQAKSNISLINSTVNNNKKHEIFNLIVFVIVCFLSRRICPYLNAFAECLLLNNVI